MRALLSPLVGLLCACAHPGPPPASAPVEEPAPVSFEPVRLTMALVEEGTDAAEPVEVRGIRISEDSEEGDLCALELEPAEGWLVTVRHDSSGFDCPWAPGTRHYPLDPEAQEAVQAALHLAPLIGAPSEPEDDLDELLEETGVASTHAVETDRGSFALPYEVAEGLEAVARAQGVRWPDHDALTRPVLVAVRSPARFVRAELEAHGVAVRTRTEAAPARTTAHLLSPETQSELTAALAALGPPPADADARRDADRSVLVNVGGTPHWFAPDALPAPARAIVAALAGPEATEPR